MAEEQIEASLHITASWLEAAADSGFEQTHYCCLYSPVSQEEVYDVQ